MWLHFRQELGELKKKKNIVKKYWVLLLLFFWFVFDNAYYFEIYVTALAVVLPIGLDMKTFAAMVS